MRRRRTVQQAASDRTGTSAVEVAAVLPVFLLVFFGLFETANAYSAVQVLNSAARRAARVGVVPSATQDSVIAEAAFVTRGHLRPQDLLVQTENLTAGSGAVNLSQIPPGARLRVTCSCQLKDALFLTPEWMTGSMFLKASATATRE
jgi:Flp pilus assembly protein TadG